MPYPYTHEILDAPACPSCQGPVQVGSASQYAEQQVAQPYRGIHRFAHWTLNGCRDKV